MTDTVPDPYARIADGMRELGKAAEKALEAMLFTPDGSTEADAKRQWEAASMNRAGRRRAEREERRAAKLATIRAVSRGIR